MGPPPPTPGHRAESWSDAPPPPAPFAGASPPDSADEWGTRPTESGLCALPPPPVRAPAPAPAAPPALECDLDHSHCPRPFACSCAVVVLKSPHECSRATAIGGLGLLWDVTQPDHWTWSALPTCVRDVVEWPYTRRGGGVIPPWTPPPPCDIPSGCCFFTGP